MHFAAFFHLAPKAVESAAAALPAAWLGVSRQAAAMALTALWQGAAVALGLAICLRLAPRGAAAHRFALWAAAFGALVGLELLPLLGSLAAPAAGATAGTAQAASAPWLRIDVRWSLLIAALWAAASVCRALDLALHSLRLRRLWRSALPVELDDILGPLAGALRMRGRRAAQICTTGEIERPGVIGFLSPRILIPEWLFARLTPGELEQIVLHETEHLRRGDDWTNLFQKLCLVLFPLNPALAWIERRLCREREMACDDGVIRITHAPRAYAACLTSLAERGLERDGARGLARRAEALSLGAWRRRPELAHRVHSVLRRKPSLSPAAARIALGAAACGLVFGSVELARCPQLFAFVQPHSATVAPTHAMEEARNMPPRALAMDIAEGKAPLVSAQSARGVRAARSSERHVADGNEALTTHRDFAAQRDPIDRAAPPQATARAELAAAAAPEENLFYESESTKSAPKAGEKIAQDRAQEQSWIVFTTWEQVQIPERDAAAEENARGNAPVEADDAIAPAGKPGTQTPGLSTRQITVTRLLLRIYSTDSRGRQHASAALEGGWLVIQL